MWSWQLGDSGLMIRQGGDLHSEVGLICLLDPFLLLNSGGSPLFENKMCLSQGSFVYLPFYLLNLLHEKEMGDSYPKLCFPKGSSNHCPYILFGRLYVDFFAVGYIYPLSS